MSDKPPGNGPDTKPDSAPDDKQGKLEPRKKTEAEKQEQKDAMINLWMGDMAQDKPKEDTGKP